MSDHTPVRPLASRQWSSESLQRGISFLKEQKQKENLEYGDILAAPSQKCLCKIRYTICIYTTYMYMLECKQL